jgi:GDP-4-dehydro-6-deoxy-D-mannose reductase
MRVLITGLTGFVGSHLAEYSLSRGAEVHGSIKWRSKTDNIDHLRDQVNMVECDLRDLSSANVLIREAQPDVVFHLAAQSFVPTSWHAPGETLSNNILCEVNLFEAIRTCGIDPVVTIAGSSEEYGLVAPDEIPLTETSPLRPMSPYAVSKIAQDFLGYQYHMSYGLKIVRTRAFNHTGPRRGDVFVESNFAKQIAEIEAGKRAPVVYVGNLEAQRDYCDVRDIVKGYWLAAEKGTPGEVYNLASGKMWAIQEVLDMLLSMSTVAITVEEDPKRLRPSDVPFLCGDSTKFREETGWAPEIPFEDTLRDLLAYWRDEIRGPRAGG